MAKRKGASRGTSKKSCNTTGWYAVKGIILLILGLALWRGLLTLDMTIAILLVLAGIKFVLKPMWVGK